MRSRVTREPFWTDSRLGRVSHAARLLFLGLWAIMDTAGRLEDDPPRTRVQIFPYDQQIDVDVLLAELEAVGLIVRYTAEDSRYIEVVEVPRWTYFYDKEKPSILPAHAKHGASFPEAFTEQAPSVEPEPEPARNRDRALVPAGHRPSPGMPGDGEPF